MARKRTKKQPPKEGLLEVVLPDGDSVLWVETHEAGVYRGDRVGIYGWLKRNGKLLPEEIRAAELFSSDYDRANMAPRYASCSYGDVRTPSLRDVSLTRRKEAQQRVLAALQAVGRRAAPYLELCVGLEQPIYVNGGAQRAEVRATLKGALSALVNHYKLL